MTTVAETPQTPAPRKRSRSRPLGRAGRFVEDRVPGLQKEYRDNEPKARAVLARLRHAIDTEPGMAWEVSEHLIPGDDFFTEDEWQGDAPTKQEVAIHIAMTTYALHQQSKQERRMHKKDVSLAAAARALAEDPDEPMDRTRVWERFAKLAQAESVSGLLWQLRGLITLLRRRNIPLDYAVLADDLVDWQDRGRRIRVQRRWSRDFFRARRHSNDGLGEELESPEDTAPSAED